MSARAVAEPWRPEHAHALDPDVRSVHGAPLLPSDFPPETLAALADGRRLSLDGQGLVRVPRVGRLEIDAAYDPAVLAHVTTVKLADEEARIVAGGPFDHAAAARLRWPEMLPPPRSAGA